MHACRSDTHVPSSSSPSRLLPPLPPLVEVAELAAPAASLSSKPVDAARSHMTHTRSCLSRLSTRASQKKASFPWRAKTLAPTSAVQRPQRQQPPDAPDSPDAFDGVIGQPPPAAVAGGVVAVNATEGGTSVAFRLRGFPFAGGRPSHAGWQARPQPPEQRPSGPSSPRHT